MLAPWTLLSGVFHFAVRSAIYMHGGVILVHIRNCGKGSYLKAKTVFAGLLDPRPNLHTHSTNIIYENNTSLVQIPCSFWYSVCKWRRTTNNPLKVDTASSYIELKRKPALISICWPCRPESLFQSFQTKLLGPAGIYRLRTGCHTVLVAPIFVRMPGSHHPGYSIRSHTWAADTTWQPKFNLYIHHRLTQEAWLFMWPKDKSVYKQWRCAFVQCVGASPKTVLLFGFPYNSLSLLRSHIHAFTPSIPTFANVLASWGIRCQKHDNYE